jgi:hypothetical protein
MQKQIEQTKNNQKENPKKKLVPTYREGESLGLDQMQLLPNHHRE